MEPVRRLPNVRPRLPGAAALPAAAAPGLAERAAALLAAAIVAAAIGAAAAVAAVDAAVGGMPLGRARERLGRCDVRILVQRKASERPLPMVQMQGLRLLPGPAGATAATMRGVVRGARDSRVARRPLPHMRLQRVRRLRRMRGLRGDAAVAAAHAAVVRALVQGAVVRRRVARR